MHEDCNDLMFDGLILIQQVPGYVGWCSYLGQPDAGVDVLVNYHKLYLVCFNMEQWLFELAKALYIHEFLDPQQSVCNRCLCLSSTHFSLEIWRLVVVCTLNCTHLTQCSSFSVSTHV